MARLATGISGFDAVVEGGLPAGSSVVLQGPPGQEKLRFALTFLAEGLKSGASGLVLISSQSPDAVLSDLRGLGVDIDAVTRENRLRIVDWYSWSEETVTDVEERGIVVRSSIDLTNLGVALSRAIAALSGETGCRSVIELLSPAMNAYELTQVYAFAQSAKKKFDRHGFTSRERLKLDPKDADALFAMAAAQATLDDTRGALQSLDRLSELDSAYPGLWVLKTKLHARLGEADRARQSRLRAQQAEQVEAGPAATTVPGPMFDSPCAGDVRVLRL